MIVFAPVFRDNTSCFCQPCSQRSGWNMKFFLMPCHNMLPVFSWNIHLLAHFSCVCFSCCNLCLFWWYIQMHVITPANTAYPDWGKSWIFALVASMQPVSLSMVPSPNWPWLRCIWTGFTFGKVISPGKLFNISEDDFLDHAVFSLSTGCNACVEWEMVARRCCALLARNGRWTPMGHGLVFPLIVLCLRVKVYSRSRRDQRLAAGHA